MNIKEIETKHSRPLLLLDEYDHQNILKRESRIPIYEFNYEEASSIVKQMMFNNKNDLFGIEKDMSFESSIETINQQFNGESLYYSLEEKAAVLLYLVVKNHSFVDGNKRIAATIFLYYLYKNEYFDSNDCNHFISSELATLIIMITISNPNDKQLIIDYITNLL